MINILCFGDSNTWGYNGENGERFAYEQRWTSIVQERLGSGYNIIPEGLNGRTTVWDDPFSPFRNGAKALPLCLLSHAPLDLVIIMLGTNDCKNTFRNTPFSIGRGIARLIEIIQGSGSGRDYAAPEVLLISPAPAAAVLPAEAAFDLREFSELDGQNAREVSAGLAEEFCRIADEYGCGFMDAGLYAQLSPADGVHLTAEGHSRLGAGIAEKIIGLGLPAC